MTMYLQYTAARKKIRSALWSSDFCISGLGGIIALIISANVLSALGVALAAYAITWYIRSLGKSIAIIETIVLVAAVQWLLAPFFAYNFDWTYQRYFMYIPESEYFGFVVPSLLLMLIGLRWCTPYIDIASVRSNLVGRYRAHVRLGGSLIFVGIIATFLAGDPSASILGFAYFLLAQLKFIGAIYFVIYKVRWRWAVALGVFFAELTLAASFGMFQNVFLWGTLMFSFFCFDADLKPLGKLALVGLTLIVISDLQGVKGQYRSLLANDPENAGIVTLIELIAGNVFGGADAAAVNSRLNEGWIVSAIMAHVPLYVPYQQGQTIVNAAVDSFVPRFLVAKAVTDQTQNFRLYTGLSAGRRTSFGISVLGEAWVNFGPWGIFFMGAFGCACGLLLKAMVSMTRKEPTIILWTPLLFLQALKAETELVVVMNHLVKSLVFILVIYFIAKQVSSVSPEGADAQA